jgi:hypothetical protein
MDMYRYFIVDVVSCMVGSMLSCFGSCSDVVKYEFSSICKLFGIGEYCYE